MDLFGKKARQELEAAIQAGQNLDRILVAKESELEACKGQILVLQQTLDFLKEEVHFYRNSRLEASMTKNMDGLRGIGLDLFTEDASLVEKIQEPFKDDPGDL